MKNLNEIKEIINQHKQELEERFKVKSIAIFGSYVREDQTPESDIDIMVELKEPVGFLFIRLVNYLEEILETRVEITTKNALKQKPRLWESVKESLTYV